MFSGYASRALEGKLIVVMQAYIDDSASDLGAKRLFLAGYASTAERWVEFSDKWAEALSASPSIEHMHMVDAAGFSGQFKGWDAESRDKKVIDLSKIAAAHSIYSFQTSISRRLVANKWKKKAPYPFHDPYMAVYINVICHAINVKNRMALPGKIDFIFDEKKGFEKNALAVHEMFRERKPEFFRHLGGTPIFRSDLDVLPIQAADMLAWHVRREAFSNGRSVRGLRESTRILTQNHKIISFNDNSVAAKADRHKPELFGYFLQDKKRWKVAREGYLKDRGR